MAGGYYTFKYLLTQINYDPEHEQKEQTKIKSAAILRRLDEPQTDEAPEVYESRPRKEDLQLSQYEQAIVQDLIHPKDIPVSFGDIGGLSHIIDELREAVIYPLTMPKLYSASSSLLAAPSGVLLYGPPGCGKTMLAKALARESGACFINLHISTLTEKWFGDSNKLVNAVFTLARKLAPTIVFIDEIDAVLGTRRSGEHEASGMVKAEFMTHWDGLASTNAEGETQRVLILGATNRIQDIDDAILRRMPKKFPVGLPSTSQRLKILKIILKDTVIDQPNFDMEYLARVMAGMSGSEIKEACREAAMIPVREMIRQQRQSGQRMDQLQAGNVRGLRTEDFFLRSGNRTSGPKQNKTEGKEWSSTSSSPEGIDSGSDRGMQEAQESQT
jgi:ATPase family AAA domain-containing protein 1